MLPRLLLAFILIPLIELILLLRMAEATSWLTTLAIVVVTGIIGSILARREGISAWLRFQAALGEGRMPGKEIQEGMMIAFAAALLLTPGLMTDAVGFALLTPPGRRVIGQWFRNRFAGSIRVQTHSSQGHWTNQEATRREGSTDPGSAPSEGTTIDSPSFRPKR